MFNLLRGLMGGRSETWQHKSTVPICPERATYVIGDIHGRADLLVDLLEQIDAHVRVNNIDTHDLVFVGDYIDRGSQSAKVLKHCHSCCKSPRQAVGLMGNHERMMLDFLQAPEAAGPRWLRHGGVQTLESFGIEGVSARSDSDALAKAAKALESTIGPKMLGWLRALPLDWISGNVVVTHAALDPDLPLTAQPDQWDWTT